MMQSSNLCPILPHHSKIIFCLMRRAEITVCRDAVSFFMEDEGGNYEIADLNCSMLKEIQSYLDNNIVHECFLLCRHPIFRCFQVM